MRSEGYFFRSQFHRICCSLKNKFELIKKTLTSNGRI